MTPADVCRDALEKIAQARALIDSIRDSRDEFYIDLQSLTNADDELGIAAERITARLAGIEDQLSAAGVPDARRQPSSPPANIEEVREKP